MKVDVKARVSMPVLSQAKPRKARVAPERKPRTTRNQETARMFNRRCVLAALRREAMKPRIPAAAWIIRMNQGKGVVPKLSSSPRERCSRSSTGQLRAERNREKARKFNTRVRDLLRRHQEEQKLLLEEHRFELDARMLMKERLRADALRRTAMKAAAVGFHAAFVNRRNKVNVAIATMEHADNVGARLIAASDRRAEQLKAKSALGAAFGGRGSNDTTPGATPGSSVGSVSPTSVTNGALRDQPFRAAKQGKAATDSGSPRRPASINVGFSQPSAPPATPLSEEAAEVEGMASIAVQTSEEEVEEAAARDLRASRSAALMAADKSTAGTRHGQGSPKERAASSASLAKGVDQTQTLRLLIGLP